MYGREGEQLSLAAVGDALLTRPISRCSDDRFREVIDRIRAADVGIANLETLFHDFEGYPAAQTGGTPLRAPPRVADDLPWAGFDMVALANNHAMDYSYGGLAATRRELAARELPCAGVGENLAEARAPAYLESPAGRVGLVAACSFFPVGAEAGEQRRDMQGRPGLSPIHVEATYTVPEDVFASLAEVSEHLGLEAEKARRERHGLPTPEEADDELAVTNATRDAVRFRSGDEYGIELAADEDDVAAVLDSVDAAARQADWVVASLHGHRGPEGRSHAHRPPAFHEAFARRCIDAGADAVVGHGPHVLRGIELYDGAPICYGLGDFVLQNQTVTRLPASIYDRYELATDDLPADAMDHRFFPADADDEGFLNDPVYWESVVPICRFEAGTLDRIEVLPVELGLDAPRPQRGRPRLATGETAERILADVQSYSEPYGTRIEVADGRGVIHA